ncbi:hypothetical protein [Sphingomonas asaccharolytica]|uniref:hypothetical protein n=1 Tax=Sphingomonas asaccharolytica TaxID=40681 RepID=UPI000AAD349C|nr:hypothetical protein [Sphingomonas asaccharolytica]
MQDRYVGDAGDFAKYSLLRALATGRPNLSLGVLWYLYPDEQHNGDGRHISYLDKQDLKARDNYTFCGLERIVRSGNRSVAAVEAAALLPNSVFFSDHVAIRDKPAARLAHRASWYENGLRALKGRDIIFFDPDNGIETAALKRSDHRAGKYVFWSELGAAWASGSSLVVYNHLNRSAPATVQTARLRASFEERLPGIGLLAPLLFRRGSCRHMWVVGQPRHARPLTKRLNRFMASGWSVDAEWSTGERA